MHDDGVGCTVLGVNGLIQPEQTPVAIRFLLRRKALLLSASDIQNIDATDSIGHVAELMYLMPGIL